MVSESGQSTCQKELPGFLFRPMHAAEREQFLMQLNPATVFGV